MRNLPSVRSYSYLLTTVPGLQTNNNNVNTGPVFAIFPIHGGRGVESRLTVDGLNISNPPGGNQPPNFVADIGNAQEVTMITSGGLGESETAGLTMNIVPKQGGNQVSGLAFVSGFSKGMQANNFTDELKARGATQPNPVFHVYDVNLAVGGPIIKDKLWYYMSVREQGQRQNTLNVYYNQNADNPNAWTYVPDLSRPAFSDRTWENYTPRVTWQVSRRNKLSFAWDEQPVCRKCSGTTSLTGSPNFIFPTSPEADGHGEFSPQRVQQARWTSTLTNKLLLEAGLGTTYYQWGGRELDPNPTRNLVQVLNLTQTIVPGLVTPMVYRSQSWLNNRTRGSTWYGSAWYVTGSHSMKFGYQGNYWRDDREIHVNDQNLRYTFLGTLPLSITEYANAYNVNASAMQASLYAQDQWTINRLTLQGALRWDHPWSWFPAQTEPQSRFFPGASFARTDGVTGYNDITPRMGAAFDLFGNGKTALKLNLGKYLQGASVSNLAYTANPALRIPGGGGGIFPPSTSRSWGDTNQNFVPDCDLTNPLLNGECGQIDTLLFGSNQLIGAQYRSEPVPRVGPSSLGLVVRCVGAAADLPARVGGGRLLSPFVHDVHHQRHGDRQPGDLTERPRRVHGEGAERHAPARWRRLHRRSALQREPERVRSVESVDQVDEGRRRRYARVQWRGRNGERARGPLLHVLRRHQHRQGRERLVCDPCGGSGKPQRPRRRTEWLPPQPVLPR